MERAAVDRVAGGMEAGLVEAGLIAAPCFLQCGEAAGEPSAGQEGKSNLSKHPAAVLPSVPPDGGLPLEQLHGSPGWWLSRTGSSLIHQQPPNTAPAKLVPFEHRADHRICLQCHLWGKEEKPKGDLEK